MHIEVNLLRDRLTQRGGHEVDATSTPHSPAVTDVAVTALSDVKTIVKCIESLLQPLSSPFSQLFQNSTAKYRPTLYNKNYIDNNTAIESLREIATHIRALKECLMSIMEHKTEEELLGTSRMTHDSAESGLEDCLDSDCSSPLTHLNDSLNITTYCEALVSLPSQREARRGEIRKRKMPKEKSVIDSMHNTEKSMLKSTLVTSDMISESGFCNGAKKHVDRREDARLCRFSGTATNKQGNRKTRVYNYNEDVILLPQRSPIDYGTYSHMAKDQCFRHDPSSSHINRRSVRGSHTRSCAIGSFTEQGKTTLLYS